MEIAKIQHAHTIPIGKNQAPFLEALEKAKVAEALKPITESWIKTDGAISKKIAALPPQVKELFLLQRATSQLQLQVECVSKIADSVGSTIKKMQQFGGQ